MSNIRSASVTPIARSKTGSGRAEEKLKTPAKHASPRPSTAELRSRGLVSTVPRRRCWAAGYAAKSSSRITLANSELSSGERH